MSSNDICVAYIKGPHGIKGDVILNSYLEYVGSLVDLGPFFDKQENAYIIQSIKKIGKNYVAHLSGIDTRNDAEKIKGIELYCKRAKLPKTADEEYYFADLAGLDVVDETDKKVGSVKAVQNYGAQDIIECIDLEGQEHLIPFTKDYILEVNIERGTVKVVFPQYI